MRVVKSLTREIENPNWQEYTLESRVDRVIVTRRTLSLGKNSLTLDSLCTRAELYITHSTATEKNQTQKKRDERHREVACGVAAFSFPSSSLTQSSHSAHCLSYLQYGGPTLSRRPERSNIRNVNTECSIFPAQHP
jgi:hypothetical protein